MPPDPNAPTPGTENEPPWIGYDAIEKLVRDFVRIYGEFRCDLATILALVSKARQRDAAVELIRELVAVATEDRPDDWAIAVFKMEAFLNALRREP